MNTILAQKTPKSTSMFECKLCDFLTCNKNHYNRHIETNKHKDRINNTNSYLNNTKKAQKAQDDKYYCECGKSYKHKPNLYAHKKKCNSEDKNDLIVYENNLDYKNMFLQLIEKTDVLHNLIIEQNKIIQEKDKRLMI